MQPKKFGVITSSVDPESISTTVQSIAKIIAGLAVFAGVLTAADSTTLLQGINQTVASIITIVPIVYSIWNSAEMVFGIIRKILVAVFKKY